MNAMLLLSVAFGFAAALGAGLRAHRLASRLAALVRPAHELRGALTALELGLSALERRRPSQLELAARSEGLHLQLGRAREAVAEIDAVRGGQGVAPGGGRRGRVDNNPETLDLTAIVEERARAWSQLASGYGEAALRLAWRAGPVQLRADRQRLSRAFDNLIANALEHGGGQVLVEGERYEGRIRIWISDAGAGFDSSARLPAEASPSSGRGHGLAIAREAIKMHGGRIAATRRRGRAAVVVELPLDSAPPVLTRASSPSVGREPATVTTPVA